MLDLLDFLAELGGLITSWRWLLSIALACLAIVAVIAVAPDSIWRWILCMFLFSVGVAGGLVWESNAKPQG